MLGLMMAGYVARRRIGFALLRMRVTRVVADARSPGNLRVVCGDLELARPVALRELAMARSELDRRGRDVAKTLDWLDAGSLTLTARRSAIHRDHRVLAAARRRVEAEAATVEALRGSVEATLRQLAA